MCFACRRHLHGRGQEGGPRSGNLLGASVLERGARVVDLVHDQDAPSNQWPSSERREVEPLRAHDLVAELLGRGQARDAVGTDELLIE